MSKNKYSSKVSYTFEVESIEFRESKGFTRRDGEKVAPATYAKIKAKLGNGSRTVMAFNDKVVAELKESNVTAGDKILLRGVFVSEKEKGSYFRAYSFGLPDHVRGIVHSIEEKDYKNSNRGKYTMVVMEVENPNLDDGVQLITSYAFNDTAKQSVADLKAGDETTLMVIVNDDPEKGRSREVIRKATVEDNNNIDLRLGQIAEYQAKREAYQAQKKLEAEEAAEKEASETVEAEASEPEAVEAAPVEEAAPATAEA